MEDSHIEMIETTIKELKEEVDCIRGITSSAKGMLEENNSHLSRVATDLADLRVRVEGIQKVLRKESRRERRNREVQLTIALVSLVFAGLLGGCALGNPAYMVLSPYSQIIGFIGAGLLIAGGVYLIFWGGKGLLHYVETG